jgi:MFS family permease
LTVEPAQVESREVTSNHEEHLTARGGRNEVRDDPVDPALEIGGGTGTVTQVSVKTRPAPARAPSRLLARSLVFSGLVSAAGDGFTIVAFGLLAVNLSGDPRWLAAVFAADRVPWVLGLPIARAVERLRRPGRVLVAASVARAGVLVALTILVAGERATVGTLVVAAFLLGTGTVAHTAAQTVLLGSIDPTEVAKTYGYLSSAEGLGYAVIGPALGGLVFALGPALPFAIDALSFVAAALLLRRCAAVTVGNGSPPPAGATIDATTTVADRGLVRAVLRRPVLATLLALAAVTGVAEAIALSMMPLFLRRDIGITAASYGVVFGAAACGGILTGLVTPHLWAARRHTDRFVIGAGLTAGFAYLAVAGQRGVVPVLALLLVSNGTIGVANTVAPTLRLEHAPANARGRTATLFRLVVVGVQPLGALVASWVARGHGTRAAMTLAGAVLVLGYGLAAAPFRRAVRAAGA